MPLLDAAATLDEARGTFTIFAVNRGQTQPLALEADLRALPGYEVVEHLVLEHENPLAVNTHDRPNEVVPRARGNAVLQDGRLLALLPKLSWNVIRLAKRTSTT